MASEDQPVPIPRRQPEVASVRGLAPLPLLLVCLALGLALAYWIASQALDLKNLALGEQTAPVFGKLDGRKMFCGAIAETPECLATARANPARRRVLWLGNSQLLAINQLKPGDETSPVVLARRLAGEDAQVMALAFPNASQSELLLMYQQVAASYAPDVVLLPAFLDDTREQRIRAEFAPVVSDPEVAAVLDARGVGADMRERLLSHDPETAEPVDDGSLQARTESWITARLEACCGMQTACANARGRIDIEMFLLRNWLFNITPQTVRPIIPEIYRQNMAATEALLADARRRGQRVIVYIPPLRSDYTPPYDPAQYARYKAETRAMALRHGARWVDLDPVVPGRLWGTKGSSQTGGGVELDFMHFQGPGHVLLAEAMLPLVREELK